MFVAVTTNWEVNVAVVVIHVFSLFFKPLYNCCMVMMTKMIKNELKIT